MSEFHSNSNNEIEIWDCIVIGLGGHGSAALAHLSLEGIKVLGIEQFERCHDKGSSHGRSRIIRQAYFEDPRCITYSCSFS
jgi:sarcosine oxidase